VIVTRDEVAGESRADAGAEEVAWATIVMTRLAMTHKLGGDCAAPPSQLWRTEGESLRRMLSSLAPIPPISRQDP
jgi:hypothetical protein